MSIGQPEATEDGLSLKLERVAAPVREQVLDQLRDAIVQLRLKPGQRLVERELIAGIGVSRTTIREALRELTAEGLVRTIPNKGAVVAVPTLTEAVELYEVRAVLEGMAGRRCAQHATDGQIQQLRDAYDEMAAIPDQQQSGRAMLVAKARFYDVLVEGAGSATIKSIIEGLRARVAVLQFASLSQAGRPAQTLEEMKAIVEAIAARDPDAASRACRKHVEHAAQTILEAMGGQDGTDQPDLAGLFVDEERPSAP